MREPAAPMRPAWGDHTAVLWLMVALSGVVGAGGSRPASPDRSADRADRPGEGNTRRREADATGLWGIVKLMVRAAEQGC